MEIKQSIIASNKYSIKCPYAMNPIGICIHNTANDASANNEVTYMKNNDNEVSFHIAVDDVEAIQGIPFNRNAWHSGDGGDGIGNRQYISIEICYSLSGGSRFDKAEQNAVDVVVTLLKRYGWGINKIKAHRDFSNKNCPHRTNMAAFIQKVQNKLNQNVPNDSSIKVGSKVKVIGNYYSTGELIPNWVKQNTYTIQQVNSTKALLKEIVSWVNLKDLMIVGGTTSSISVGSKVKVIGSKYVTGEMIPTWVTQSTYTVMEINSNKALLKEIMSWVYISDLV